MKTSKPSPLTDWNGMELAPSILLSEESPASRLRWLASVLAGLTNAGFGRSSSVWYARWNPIGGWLKTHAESPQLPLMGFGMESVRSPQYSEKWPVWGIVLDGVAGELPTLERRTSASASSSSADGWPTPHANCHTGPGAHGSGGLKVQTATHQEEANWPTPAAVNRNENESLEDWLARREQCKAKHNNGNGFGVQLAKAVQIEETVSARPTPRASDGAKGGPNQKFGDGSLALSGLVHHTEGSAWPTPTTRDWRNGKHSEATAERNARPLSEVAWASNKSSGQLNPHWVSALQNFPIWWLDEDDDGTVEDAVEWALDPLWPARPGQRQHEWEPPRLAEGVKGRVAKLRALGNAVVPAQCLPIFGAIVAAEEALSAEEGAA